MRKSIASHPLSAFSEPGMGHSGAEVPDAGTLDCLYAAAGPQGRKR